MDIFSTIALIIAFLICIISARKLLSTLERADENEDSHDEDEDE